MKELMNKNESMRFNNPSDLALISKIYEVLDTKIDRNELL